MDTTNLIFSTSDELAISFVPAFIRKKYNDSGQQSETNYIKEDHAALLWIDICNFSPLCNRLMKDTVNGVEKITGILHSHYDFLLTFIKQYGGQPIFFAGDGVMSAWPGDKKAAGESVRLAACCADKIISERKTLNDNGDLLSLHAIISVGPWQMTELEGIKSKRLYSFFGEVFSTLTQSSKNKAPNQILISNNALAFLGDQLKNKPVEYDTSILLDFPELLPQQEKNFTDLPEDVVQKLKSFVPQTLAFPLNKERLEWSAELRPVTILFVRLPKKSESTTVNVNQLHESVSLVKPLVLKYDGLLNQVWMDEKESNMLICFGPPPSAHNDNPERTVRLAFEIHNLLQKSGFENSIGVSTGMAYCGILGNNSLRQYTVIGDVVNLSAHITIIKNNIIYCDKATFSTTAKTVKYSGPFMEKIKSRPEPIPLYVPEGLLTDDAKSLHLLSVGRTNEMNVLMDTFNHVSLGGNACVIIEGESGMGKTKLLEDFSAQIALGDCIVLSGSGDFIFRNTPYSVMGSVFSALLGFNDALPGKNQREKLRELELKYGSKACLLNAVLQSDFPESEEIRNLTGSQKVAATHDFLLNLLEEESKLHPAVIIIDDAQWMDETTWSLLESINSKLEKCLVILSFPEAERISRIKNLKLKNTERIRLKELPGEDQEKIICARLGVTNMSPEVLSLIKKIAKGNPFFCAELAGSLLEQELLVLKNDSCFLAENASINELSLPETVRGAVRRRIDRIDPRSQLSLKVASVVGNRFPSIVVRNIYPIESDRRSVSAYLKDIKLAGFTTDLIVDKLDGYRFNNATVAEVAYEMTLNEQRKLLHRETAEWYETYFREDLPAFYVRLAHHWIKAGDKNKAAVYNEKEAIRLFRMGFVKQALDVGLEAVRMLDLTIEREPEVIKQKIGEHLGAIGSLMSSRSIESLIDHKKLEDQNSENIIKLLLELGPFAHQSQQVELFALMSIICLRITLEQGNGESAAEVYSMYSIIYKSLTGDSITAFAWSNLALAVDAKNNNSLKARVNFIHCWFIAHWMVPIRELIPIAEKGADAGFKGGDILFACFDLSLCVVLKSTAGVHLDEVIETAQIYSLRNNQAVINASFHLMHEEQVAKAFQGRTDSYTSLTDEKFDETNNIASICNTDLYNQIGYYLVSKLKLNAHFGNWREAIEWGDKALPVLPAFANQPGHFELEQYYTLASIYRAAETEGDISANFVNKANTGIETMKAWAALCPENFLHKTLLLQAIREGLNGDPDEAVKMFEQAAEKAMTSEFIQDCGLAYEHMARMQKRLGSDYKKAVTEATDAYNKWGADGKVAYLHSEFEV